MASLTTPTAQDQRFELIKPTRPQVSIPEDRAAGILPAGGIQDIIKQFSKRGLAGQAPLSREIARTQIPTLSKELGRLGREFSEQKREELRPLELQQIQKQKSLQDILAQIGSFVPPTFQDTETTRQELVSPGTPGRAPIPGTPAVPAIPDLLIPGIDANLAYSLYGNESPFSGFLNYDPTGTYPKITQSNNPPSSYSDLIFGPYSGFRSFSSQAPSTFEITPDFFKKEFSLTGKQLNEGFLGPSNLGGATVDPLIILSALNQGFITPQNVLSHISATKNLRGSNLSSYDAQALQNLQDLLNVKLPNFFTEASKLGTPEIPGTPGIPGIAPTDPVYRTITELMKTLVNPGSGGDINALNQQSASLTSDLQSLQSLIKQIQSRPGVGKILQEQTREPLLSPGRPEENFARYLPGGTIVKSAIGK